MKLYAYSSESASVVESRWITIKSVLVGFLLGSCIFFTFFKLNDSTGEIFRTNKANSIETENYLLRDQVNNLSPKIYNLKMRTNYLTIRSTKLDKLLFRTELIDSRDSGLSIEAKTFKFQSLLFASKASNP